MLLARTLILILFISSYANTHASELEQSVFQLSVDVKTLLLKYYHLQADEGNSQRIDEVYQKRDEVNSQQLNLIQSLGPTYAPYKQRVTQHWNNFNRLLEENIAEIQENNFPELQLVTIMRDAQVSMLHELELLSEAMISSSEVQLSEIERWQRNQKNLILNVVELYIERAASPVGGPLTNNNVDSAALCQQFGRGIELMQGRLVSPDAQRLLSKIQNQWLFIETAATNNDTRLVPFLVMRYTETILSRLNTLNQYI